MPGRVIELIKNKKYKIVVEAGDSPSTGNRHRPTKIFYGKKRDAELLKSRLETEIAQGKYVDPSKLTLGDYLRRWFDDYVKMHLAPSTQRRYAQILNLRVIPLVGAVPMDNLRPLHIREFYKKIIQDGCLDGGEPLSQASLTYHHRVLHRALQSAVEDELLDHNIIDAVPAPKVQQMVDIDADADIEDEKVKVLDNSQVDKMLDAAKGTPYYEMLYLDVHTGLRRGELLGVRWKDLIRRTAG